MSGLVRRRVDDGHMGAPQLGSFERMEVEHIDCGLALHGELDAAAAEHFDPMLQEALLDSGGVFVLDLTGLSYMDSGGINAL